LANILRGSMDIEKLYNRLTRYIPNDLILKNESMKKHTSFRIGGPADILLHPSDSDHIRIAIMACKELDIPFFIMGNGTNLLVKDNGFRGLIVKISQLFSKHNIKDNEIWAQSGALLSTISKASIEAELSGLEFAVGIPGTVGGAVAMNAGSYTGEMENVIKSVLVLDNDGNQINIEKSDLSFAYRSSRIQNEKLIVLEAILALQYGNKATSKALVEEYTRLRQQKQPLSLPSAGSVFKRPPGFYAGKLIDETGLRGYRIGDAQISDLHCGFIVNIGDASASDVLSLIDFVRDAVRNKTGIELLLEIKVIGE